MIETIVGYIFIITLFPIGVYCGYRITKNSNQPNMIFFQGEWYQREEIAKLIVKLNWERIQLDQQISEARQIILGLKSSYLDKNPEEESTMNELLSSWNRAVIFLENNKERS